MKGRSVKRQSASRTRALKASTGAIKNAGDPYPRLTARLRALGSRARAEKEKSY